jgi:hypothetical protein
MKVPARGGVNRTTNCPRGSIAGVVLTPVPPQPGTPS